MTNYVYWMETDMLYKYICQSLEYTFLIDLYTLHMLNINGLKL